MVNEVTFVDFMGGDRPPGSAPGLRRLTNTYKWRADKRMHMKNWRQMILYKTV